MPIASIASIASPIASPFSSTPPDIGADLIASQTKSATASAGVIGTSMKGGRLLKAIRNKTASLNAMLRLRKFHKKSRKSRG